jgi:hypothetical protein
LRRRRGLGAGFVGDDEDTWLVREDRVAADAGEHRRRDEDRTRGFHGKIP